MTDADKSISFSSITPARSLAQLLYAQFAVSHNHSALMIDDVVLSYAALTQAARQLANWLTLYQVQRLGILASRSVEAYVGVLAAHWAGIAYIPLNPTLPVLRLKKIIEQADLHALVIDTQGLPLLHHDDLHFLSGLPIIAPYHHTASPHFQWIKQTDIQASPSILATPVEIQSQDLAYIMFTSGTTGEPKGVPISFGNLGCFVNNIKNRYLINSADRISQFSSLSFDVSILDMILAWHSGATLCVVPERELLGPAKFIRTKKITVWVAVPSSIHMMQQLHMLKENCFPDIKYSVFTGEALLVEQARLWQRSAPNSQLDNLYGPTEVTIDCMAAVYHENNNPPFSTVSIGKPFSGAHAALINADYKFLAMGEKGELVIAGDQVSEGYWQDRALTQQKFVSIKHPELGEKKWYRTGDYCYQDMLGDFYYLSRLDNQCKILGKRIELEEIEYHLRNVTQFNEVAVLALTLDSKMDKQIIAATTLDIQNTDTVKEQLKQYLPTYMIPTQIIYVANLPHNANGKLDRKALAELLIHKINVKLGKSSC
jgi:D-alanine--poly(phosphoribitol) ligase subunit 1